MRYSLQGAVEDSRALGHILTVNSRGCTKRADKSDKLFMVINIIARSNIKALFRGYQEFVGYFAQ
jgi:hypothetical protein